LIRKLALLANVVMLATFVYFVAQHGLPKDGEVFLSTLMFAAPGLSLIALFGRTAADQSTELSTFELARRAFRVWLKRLARE
jgi:hypothetical protein